FAFDHCFWSMLEGDPRFQGQEAVFEALGVEILERAYEGYNGCIFAYGQTGSGKSYSMMGTHEQKGIIPRLCDTMFEKIKTSTKEDLVYKVEVSYMEIYNEKVHDLLDLKGNKQNLKVREHSILGPYVDGLSMLAVSSFEDINNLMNEGNKSRTVAATNMNNESSRSHAVFNIVLTQTLTDLASGVSGEKVSKLSLVDLAGSERAQKTGAVGDRLKEGSNINKSLTTLGLVISSLADQAAGKNKNKFVPYRDSVLTWLLKDNLGGNSKTVMIATISPAGDNYEETLSTLRYADRAKRIVNHAVVNEDPNARIIRDLREELEMLRNQLRDAQSMQAPDLKDRLQESEHLMKEMTKTWEEKLKETDMIHTQRHNALEQMGISVETSGIKVEQGRAFLVNLNADPSLNELLVYYLKEHTLVGSHNARVKQDIHLSGLGILPEHCVVDIDNNEIFLTPFDGARTCVNGSVIKDKTKVKHGDRILWGNNHFFRVNCPKPTNSPQSSEPENQLIDYDFAQHELMMKELGDDPIQEAIGAIEKQHEEEKQEALDKQRQMYERQMQMLRNKLMSPGNPSFPMQLFEMPRLTPTGNPTTQNSIQKKYQQWAVDREKSFKQSLSKLREEVVKANTLVREGNFLSQEMNKQTEFHVTLQIPASNLSPNRRRGAFISEPAILVKRQGRPNQIWSMEKLENKVIDMREVYEERRNRGLPMMDEGPPQKGDPFYESQENHNLIGVANVFLDCLFYDVKLDYHVPIISQQGEITGKLHIELSKVGGAVLDRYVDIHESGEENSVPMGAPLLVRVCIKEARGLPPALCHFVFCQYSFWGLSDTIVVAPEINPDNLTEKHDQSLSFIFNHQKDFRIPITEEFIEHCSEGALSIEVWGHRSQGFGINGSLIDSTSVKTRTLIDRWNEVMRKIEFWVEIHELNDQGEYVAVETTHRPDVPCAGIFQLRQGHSRRVLVRVKPVANSGTLPLICEAITSISVGCITARSKLQKGLDSYQEEDLNHLRERWTDALKRRKEYLDEQIQQLINKPDKSEADAERERALIEQWVSLTEERNAVLVPAPGSCIPGAPADWDPPLNVEEHSPVLFLDLNADDMSTPNTKEGLQAAGVNSILPKEHGSQLINLPITKSFPEKENVCAVASWDSSIHDSQHLNRVTPANERIYVILKAVVRLSHPASMELVLRKRLCINIYKKQSLTSFTHMLKNRIIGTDYLTSSSIIYEVVSNIPKGSEDLEEMETLAQMAASPNQINSSDGETYIEKYIRGISAVESILTLDRLRQEVAVKELLAVTGRSGGMLRKTTSVPNINQVTRTDGRTNRFYTHSLSRTDGRTNRFYTHSLSRTDGRTNCFYTHSLSRIYGRTNCFYTHSLSRTDGSKSVMSPHSLKLMKPMTTLLEEQNHREQKPLLHQSTEEELDEEDEDDLGVKPVHHLDDHQHDSDDFQEFESFQSQQTRVQSSMNNMTHSSTNDSLVEGQTKSYTPSMTSSGYASQAVSTLTLSSEDSMSIKSIEEHGDGKGKKMRQKSASTETSSETEPFFQSNDPKLDNQTKNSEADTKDLENGQKTSDGKETTESESSIEKDANNPEMKKESEKTIDIKESQNVESESSKAESSSVNALEELEKLQDIDEDADESSQPLSDKSHLNRPISDESLNKSSNEVKSLDRADVLRRKGSSVPSWVKEGEGVTVTSSRGTVPKSGVVRFVGQVDFAAGNWIGVELDQPEGKNDGSVNKQRYFKCRSRHGIFVRPDKLIWDKKRKSVKGQSSRRSSGMTSSVSSGSLSGSKGRTPTKK
ncbi:hypothetical protein LOTGIDRAFT_133948, partial [Lottia gigantea]